MPTIEKANMEWWIIRKHLAKMISVYAINILRMKPDTDKKACEDFEDMKNDTVEMKLYTKLACQLWLMWLETDWKTPQKNFWQNLLVNRAQFGTVMSRMLRGTKNVGNENNRYINHLTALKKEKIMNYIETPLKRIELRWYVMLMLMKSNINNETNN